MKEMKRKRIKKINKKEKRKSLKGKARSEKKLPPIYTRKRREK